MTDPTCFYVLRHVVTGRWVARRGETFFWHPTRGRACKVRGGPKLDALLATRCVRLVVGDLAMGCDVEALPHGTRGAATSKKVSAKAAAAPQTGLRAP